MRRDAVRSGLTEDEIRRALRTGALERLDAGVHLPREIAADLDDAGRHLVRVRAAAAKLGPEAVMSTPPPPSCTGSLCGVRTSRWSTSAGIDPPVAVAPPNYTCTQHLSHQAMWRSWTGYG
ncbi:hypothetical protein [Rhodococcus sp. YH1]|uniref:hypothetical protein n=1 Tax=Rhodococcus sp. YH1 TaxID=89066 RepID=UPI001A035012|nr:hypothetical protein [Rhodococcus sp. YH1]